MNTNTSMTRALWQCRPRGWDIGTKGIKLCPASLALASALGIAAATLMAAETAPNLKVVASTSDLAALTVEVGGDRIVVESIVQGNQDPVWSKISNVLNRLGFRCRTFFAQLRSETSRACTIRVGRSSLRR